MIDILGFLEVLSVDRIVVARKSRSLHWPGLTEIASGTREVAPGEQAFQQSLSTGGVASRPDLRHAHQTRTFTM
jgi:hypothetical protein